MSRRPTQRPGAPTKRAGEPHFVIIDNRHTAIVCTPELAVRALSASESPRQGDTKLVVRVVYGFLLLVRLVFTCRQGLRGGALFSDLNDSLGVRLC